MSFKNCSWINETYVNLENNNGKIYYATAQYDVIYYMYRRRKRHY